MRSIWDVNNISRFCKKPIIKPMWNNLNDRYDADYALAELDRLIITAQHYLRHIAHQKDSKTANEYHHKIYLLEANARRVMKETREPETNIVVDS